MIKFGTGGWREIIGDEFTKSNIQLICQALSNHCTDKQIVVGYDRRFLSEKSAKWCCEVFAGNGIKTYFINSYSPTPLTMFAVQNLNTIYGLSVTASHNPAEYNGVKVFTQGGRDATEDITEKIEMLANSNIQVKTMDYKTGRKLGLIEKIFPFNDYIDSIINLIDMESIKQKRLKILIDPMHGVSKNSLQTVLMTARCNVDIINENQDALFGGKMPSPAEKTLGKLMAMVVDDNYDLGIATDGDADRIGIIDDKGKFIHPNEIMSMLYYYMLEYKNMKGPVVRNIATTHLLDRIAKDYGEVCYEVPVGFKHISAKMEQTNALIGGESSGGLTIRGHIRGKDGIFASALLVEMISVTNKNLSELLDLIYKKYGKCFLVERDYSFSNEIKENIFNLIFTTKSLPIFEKEIVSVSYLDGIKIIFRDSSWIIARFSGTEPLLRVFCESSDLNEAESLTNSLELFLGL